MYKTIKEEIRNLVKEAVSRAQAKGELKSEVLPPIDIEIPKEKGHGDLSTNFALKLGQSLKVPPRQVAEVIVKNIKLGKGRVGKVEVAGPGFINFFLDSTSLSDLLKEIVIDENFGRSQTEERKRIQVEFVSANPTGPLNVVNARAAAVGDAIANLLKWVGHEVEREYYINDTGSQVDLFAKSVEYYYLRERGREVEFPQGGYRGSYVKEIALKIIEKYKNEFLEMSEEERLTHFRRISLEEMVESQKRDLEHFGVTFDHWFSERTLHESGELKEALDLLEERGYIYEQEGALWFKSTTFGDEKDRVVIRENRVPTYFAADIAYHHNKFERGFQRVIDLWGPDHHGHITRMKAAVEALGYSGEQLDILIVQMVTLLRKGEQVRMSKRAGEFITMEELVEEVGKDAARFFFFMRSTNSHLDFDLELAKRQSEENPVYYVQYAHARICSIMAQRKERNIPFPDLEEVDLTRLKEEEEIDLIKQMVTFPEVISGSAEALEPHRLIRYLLDLSSIFHSYYNKHRVLGEDKRLTAARLVLVEAVRRVIRNGLSILGISAPEKM